MARALGLLEALGLAEEVGAQALSFEEVLWMAEARKKKGCKLVANQLTQEDIKRAIELGRKCLAYKEGR
jgi:hypothetical protein